MSAIGSHGPLVIVEGLPGSGKTALARPLARYLGVPYVAKDVIKETLGDVIGAADRAASQMLGRASVEVMYALVADVPAAVVDSFWNPVDICRERLLALRRPMIEVFCRCPAEVALDRAGSRVRHDVHKDGAWLPYYEPTSEFLRPLGLGGPLLEVDTTAEIDIAAVAAWVRVQEGWTL